jgi:hypothetical protein
MNLQRLTFLVVIVVALANILSAADAERVMTLEVQLNGAVLSKTAFPLLTAQRGIIVGQPQKTISFSFKSEHDILWMIQKGITVTPIRTKPNQEIECSISIWHADADSGWPTISASFFSGDGILTKAIHIAHPKKRDRSEIATGLFILTYPAKHEK